MIQENICQLDPAGRSLPRFITKKEIAHHLRIGVRSIDNWMVQGLIPYIKIGRAVRFNIQQVEEHLNRVNSFNSASSLRLEVVR
jgi:excisionase family DNA binding protein